LYSFIRYFKFADGGSDNPDENTDLHHAISRAKAANLPKDKIEAAIRRGSDSHADGGVKFEHTVYEGVAVHGI